jgi:hypothetical protein
MITVILILLSLQGISYGYMLGSWNRINYILEAVHDLTPERVLYFEQFINMAPTAGLLMGRLSGSFYVNKGRFRCIVLGSLIIIAGIGM